MKPQLSRFFRPHALPSEGIPLGVRSVGEYAVVPGWKDESFRKSFFQFFWGIEGAGRITIDGVAGRLGPGQVAVYAPGMLHLVEALDFRWHYRWFTLDGPEAAAVIQRLGLHPGIYEAGPVPEELFGMLEETICIPSRQAELQNEAVAYQLLCRIAQTIIPGEGSMAEQVLMRKAIDLCRRHWSHPQCTVGFLAGQLGIHRSSLTRIFNAALGIAPGDYLAGMRLQNAKSLLKETTLPIAEIARQCGYDDANYFSRLFRQRCGMTPKAYRRQEP